MTTHQARFV